MNTNEIAQLAKTFSTACKKVVEESKVQTCAAPIMVVPAVEAALTIKVASVYGPPWP